MVEVADDLKNGATDVALTYDTYTDSSIEFEGLFQTPPHVLLSANDPLAKQEAVSLHDLVEKPMVLLNLPVSRELFLNFFRMHGLQPRIRFRPKSFEMVRSLVGAGFGFSFAFLRLKSEQSYQGNPLVRRRIIEKLPPSRVCLAVPPAFARYPSHRRLYGSVPGDLPPSRNHLIHRDDPGGLIYPVVT